MNTLTERIKSMKAKYALTVKERSKEVKPTVNELKELIQSILEQDA